jgi:hypothetical protein
MKSLIRLWSLQPSEVWEALQREGVLQVDASHPGFRCDQDIFQESYEWMRRQMARRITGYSGGFPWWAYTHKVDLRRCRRTAPQGEPWARLELRLPRERVLLSRYDTWHYVLSGWYLPEDLDDELEAARWAESLPETGWKPGTPVPEPWRTQRAQSWERIFDLNETSEEYTVQAVFEELIIQDVVRVDHYLGSASAK